MVKLTVLGSGSRGNSLVVDNGQTVVLVDAGYGCRALARRLNSAGYAPESIAALLLTHEHVDHAQGAMSSARRWNWPIFASAGTRAAVERMDADRLRRRDADFGDDDGGRPPALPVRFEHLNGVVQKIDTLQVMSHRVSHDASEPVGITVEDSRSGARIGIAVDLGHVPQELSDAFGLLDLLLVESNHDIDMLHNGPYPAALKRRIISRRGHLSNEAAGNFAAACAHRGLRNVVLAHLSETNNRPEQALRTVGNTLARAGWKGDIVAASQRSVTGPLAVHPSGFRSTAPVQLLLAL